MSSPLITTNFTAGKFGTANVPLFYSGKFEVWDKPNFYPADWQLPLFPDPPNPEQHLKETSNVVELIIEPFRIDIDPEDIQSGAEQWQVNLVPVDGESDFYPQDVTPSGQSDFYPDLNLILASTFYPESALGGSANVVEGLAEDC